MSSPDLHKLHLPVHDWDTLADILRSRMGLATTNSRQYVSAREWARYFERSIKGLRMIENLELPLPLETINRLAEVCCEHKEVGLARRIWQQLELSRLPQDQEVCR